METNILDIVVLAIVALSALRGLLRGLSRELADLIRVIGALLLAYFFYHPVAALIFEHTRLTELAAALVGFILVLIVSFLLLTIIHYILSKFMEFAFKGPIEKIGGFLSGMIKGAIFASLLVFLTSFWPHDAVRKAVREESLAGRWICSQYPRAYTNIAERYPIIYELHESLTNNVPDIVKSPPQSETEVRQGPETSSEQQTEPID